MGFYLGWFGVGLVLDADERRWIFEGVGDIENGGVGLGFICEGNGESFAWISEKMILIGEWGRVLAGYQK
ncbi:MAG: hypothetical protein JW855_05810 [Gammaproteobacteria bacterium]|nr:hypothetical protein [Gammaproteobacteria bacterium]